MTFHLFPKAACLKTLLFSILFLGTSVIANAQDAPFITVWQTDNLGGSEDNQITIPGKGTNYTIDWEEVGNEANNNGSETGTNTHTITFPMAGKYRVKISGDFSSIRFFGSDDGGKIVDIEQWGDVSWTYLGAAFVDCSNLYQTATDSPNLSKVNTLFRMFDGASSFNGDLSAWDVSKVTNMSQMFNNATSFTSDLSAWDVSNVTDMSLMFAQASSFNSDLSAWDVSNVTNMRSMFGSAVLFNGDISNWDVANVTDMNEMFHRASSFNSFVSNWDVSSVTNMFRMFAFAENFNQAIGNWNVSNVKNMNLMFSSARNFNQDLSKWNVSNVTMMGSMFNEAKAFNQDIDIWDVSNVTDMSNMFADATSFNGDISSWNVSSVTDMSFMFRGSTSFNSIISTWDVSNVTNMKEMFRSATVFNQDLSEWDITKVIDMDKMFLNASNFNQSLDKWNISNISSMYDILKFSNISSENFDKTIIAWSMLDTIPENINMGELISLVFCESLDAQYKLINIFGWSIRGTFYCFNDKFVTRWKTDNQGISNENQINIPATGTDYLIEWEEIGNLANNGSTLASNNFTLTLPNAGEYRLIITGDFTAIRFANSGDKNKLLSVDSWGFLNWKSMESAFYGCQNLAIKALNDPDLRLVTDLSFTFRETKIIGKSLGSWFTRYVSKMEGMFRDASEFNANINNWDVSAVSSFANMFSGATKFNQSLGSWNLSSATSMTGILDNAGLSTFNYVATLNAWSSSGNIAENITLGVEGIFYCYEVGRNSLINDYNWTFLGDLKDCSNQFVTVWKTDNPGKSEDNQIIIPGAGTNYFIEWEEVGNESNNNGIEIGTGYHTITFPTTGIYRVKISGSFSQIFFFNGNDKDKIIEIAQWGDISWSRLDYAFNGCSNLIQTAVDAPNLSNVNNLSHMFDGASLYNGEMQAWDVSKVIKMTGLFRNATSFNRNLNSWNVSNVENMSEMFFGASAFNENIGGWDVSTVADMSLMFKGASQFNKDLNSWNVGKVTNMQEMFSEAKSFNGNIGQWNVSNVDNMQQMFNTASVFNQELNSWDVEKVKNMHAMFSEARSFNGNISNWNVANVQDFNNMFYSATAFNQSLDSWNISNAINMNGFFDYTSLTEASYESTLTGWAALANVPDSVRLGARGLTHCNSTARSFLVSQKNWTFVDDMNTCFIPFITSWKTDNPGTTNNNQILFPGSNTNYSIEWEEVGNPDNKGVVFATNQEIVTFPNAGVYKLSVRGEINTINFGSSILNSDRHKLIEIQQWGETKWVSLNDAFFECDSLIYNATDIPNLSLVTNMSNMFASTHSFNGAINNWDVSNVTDMSSMFADATSFNGDISSWNVSSVTDMSFMFSGSTSFNSNISNWDVSNVTDMKEMFASASSFNQNVGSWNIANVSDINAMLFSSGLSVDNYDKILIGWSKQDSLKTNLQLGANGLNYCLASGARDILINEKGWTILGDSENCQSAFISSWDSDNEGESESNQITIPANGGDYLVLWEDINNDSINGLDAASGYHTVNFPNAGNYRIKISGELSGLYFSDLGDKLKITEIENWGDIQWISMNTAFAGAENLTITATDAPDLSQVTDMSLMFYNAKSLNQDISNWDVSRVTDMSDLFHGASAFNQNLSTWNVSNVTKMTRMFARTDAFNQDLSTWNTANVEEMDFMFWDADAFQGDISNWDVSKVNNMWGMFYSADSMNTDISNWDVSNVTNMTEMFREAATFNQDLSNWNVSNVTDMSGMFYEATSFNQNLGGWDLSNASSLFEFLTNAGLSANNYDLSLEGWATSGNIPTDIALSAEGLFYCASEEYRQQLIDDFGWNIIGDETCSLVLQATFPAEEATAVDKDTEISLTFDQEIEEIDLAQITLKDISGNAIAINEVFIDSLTLHILSNELGFDTYEVTIPEASIVSVTGKVNDAITWSFSTQTVLNSKEKQMANMLITYPNPFSDFTNISFQLEQSQSVSLQVFDLKGQLVRQAQYGKLTAGEQSIKFERKDLPAGLYHYQLQTVNGNIGGKMLVK